MDDKDLIDERARSDIADLRERVARKTTGLQAGVERSVEIAEETLERVVKFDGKLDGVCKKVDGHHFWILAVKSFLLTVAGVATLLVGAWLLNYFSL